MGFGQGLSGLNAASQQLDVIGNNIANSGTVGFKASTVAFADVYASSRVGLGTQVSGINQRFTIGNISTTGNQFDMAIDGAAGLFRLEDTNGAIIYSRNGQFHANKDGFIVNAQGHKLTGYGPDGATLGPVKVPTGNVAPKATTAIQTTLNLDANQKAPTGAFSPTDANTFNFSYPLNVYDSQGNKHLLTQYFIKSNTVPNQWTVRYTIPDPAGSGQLEVGPGPAAPHTLTFAADGTLTTTPTSIQGITIGNATPNAAWPAAQISLSIDYAGSTQFAGDFAYDFTLDGNSTGDYASMSIASDGTIVASYTNGQTRNVGWLALANFANLQGLQPVGGNAWVETSASGQPTIGIPGTNGLATIMGQAVEESNVDMSQELVNMIIAQRTYQANAQTIKTQDQILQTLITMR